MTINIDTIKFSSRAEINEILLMIRRYWRAYPEQKENETISRLYDLLDTMMIG